MAWKNRIAVPDNTVVDTTTVIPATGVLEDADHRFVSDTEKAQWNMSAIEARTSDPIAPVIGQIWLRTDL